jgi:hypothetical protein
MKNSTSDDERWSGEFQNKRSSFSEPVILPPGRHWYGDIPTVIISSSTPHVSSGADDIKGDVIFIVIIIHDV